MKHIMQGCLALLMAFVFPALVTPPKVLMSF